MESVLRALTIYAILLFVTRISGRRTLNQATPFDFVLLLIIAETTQQALVGDDPSLTNAVVLIVTLFAADIALSHLKRMSTLLSLWLDGTPTVLISAGRVDARALHRARVTLDEILEAARSQHGLSRLDQIEAAVLEIGGHISIIPERPEGEG